MKCSGKHQVVHLRLEFTRFEKIIGDVVDYVDKLFHRLFNIFEIADVDTPSCRPVSANVTPYSVLSRNSGAVIRLGHPFFFTGFLVPVNALYIEMPHQDGDDIVA